MRKIRGKEALTINLTPLIDVVFLLLIFFMVSTSFNRETQLSLRLPEAEGEPLQVEQDIVEISVDESGHYFVNAKPIINTEVATLKEAIDIVAAGRVDIPVVISGDANAPYQAIMTAMDAAGQLGYNNLTLATSEPIKTQP